MQAVSHEPEKRVTPVFLCPQAESFGRYHSSSRFGNLMEGPRHVGELNAVIGLEQSLLSHHLKVLREEGFVEATRDGKAVLYSLTPAVQRANAGRAIDLGCCLLSFN
jgi:ArsR family transcriptional regulator